MANLPLALSVHHFVSSVGADAGFAAIIGLAILVLLYFAQARETANLREQAYEAAQRVAQLEARLTSIARQQAAAAQAVPARAGAQAGGIRTAAPAPAPAFAGAVAMAPGPPAGVGAPALAAATRLIPATPVAEPQPAYDEHGVAAPDGQPVDDTALGSLAPATAAAAAGGNGSSKGGVASPPRVTPPPRGVLPPARGGRPAQAARRPGPASAGAGRAPVAPPPPFSAPPRKRLGLRIALVLVGALVIAGIVVALLHFTNSGGSSNPTRASSTSNAPGTSTTRRKRTAAVVPSTVTVSVLNGTATNGLAGRISNQLSSAGYKQGRVATASDQTRTATIVAYMPGHKQDALAVAKALKLGPASVQPVDPATQAVACPVSTQCTSQVVVTVGTDLAA